MKIIYLSVFSISLGYLEAAVVVYLRMQYYPQGFYFPVAGVITDNVLLIEIFREISTIVILLSVSLISAKKFIERFGSFLFVFALWDIFYYIFLKIILGWPASVLEKDILFLIPIPWIAPVLAPIIVSATLIALAMSIHYLSYKNPAFNNLAKVEWIIFSLGSILIFSAFIVEYLSYRFESLRSNSLYNTDIFQLILFITGELFLITVIILLLMRKRK